MKEKTLPPCKCGKPAVGAYMRHTDGFGTCKTITDYLCEQHYREIIKEWNGIETHP